MAIRVGEVNYNIQLIIELNLEKNKCCSNMI